MEKTIFIECEPEVVNFLNSLLNTKGWKTYIDTDGHGNFYTVSKIQEEDSYDTFLGDLKSTIVPFGLKIISNRESLGYSWIDLV